MLVGVWKEAPIAEVPVIFRTEVAVMSMGGDILELLGGLSYVALILLREGMILMEHRSFSLSLILEKFSCCIGRTINRYLKDLFV